MKVNCQTVKDAYFILEKDSPTYIVKNNTSLNNEISDFKIYNRKEYLKAKKEGLLEGPLQSSYIPKSLYFTVIKSYYKHVTKSEIVDLKLVDYVWLRKYGWQSKRNPNKMLKDLYFFLEINGKYKKYKVNRVIKGF